MYNRYIKDDQTTDESMQYVPVARHAEPFSSPSPEGDPLYPPDLPAQKRGGGEGLLRMPPISIETFIILGLALFLLCDRPDDIGDALIILAILLILGF